MSERQITHYPGDECSTPCMLPQSPPAESLAERRERLGDFVLFRHEGAEARFLVGDGGSLVGVGRLHGLTVWSVIIPEEEVRGLRTWLEEVEERKR